MDANLLYYNYCIETLDCFSVGCKLKVYLLRVDAKT
jgi:hypothetical protein